MSVCTSGWGTPEREPSADDSEGPPADSTPLDVRHDQPLPPGPYGSPVDDFSARSTGGGQQPQRQRSDITQFLSQQARELVNATAHQAVVGGSADLGTEHLLRAMTGDESTRQVLARSGTDPDRLRSSLEEQLVRGEPRDEPPSLTPAASTSPSTSPRRPLRQASGE